MAVELVPQALVLDEARRLESLHPSQPLGRRSTPARHHHAVHMPVRHIHRRARYSRGLEAARREDIEREVRRTGGGENASTSPTSARAVSHHAQDPSLDKKCRRIMDGLRACRENKSSGGDEPLRPLLSNGSGKKLAVVRPSVPLVISPSGNNASTLDASLNNLRGARTDAFNQTK